jgi:hypothetical protein
MIPLGSEASLALASIPATETPALRAGTDIRLQSTHIVGAALVADGRLVHAVAFPSDSTAVR